MAILLFADPDYPVTEEHHRYWSELGRFIHRFAMLEQQIHFLLQLYAGTPHAIAQALFSGTRGKAGIDLIKRLREVKVLPADAGFDRAVSQYGIISGVRDLIVHSGAILYREGFVATNANRTIPRQHQETPISPKELSAMTADLQIIFAALFVMQCEANGDDITAYATDFREMARTPWEFKPRPKGRKGTMRDEFLGDATKHLGPRSRHKKA